MNDEVIRFAAEKVGGYIVFDRIFLPPKEGEHYCNFASHDLSSPDLFLRGLGVFHEQYKPEARTQFLIQRDGSLEFNLYRSEDRYYDVKNMKSMSDLPEIFWACWFKLEKGGA